MSCLRSSICLNWIIFSSSRTFEQFEGDGEASLRALDIEGRDRVHTLFSGTSLVALTAPSSASSLVEPASAAGTGPGRVNVVAPDGGCLCYVLRTGFSSSQGELMQMIEFSTQQVYMGC